MCISCFCPEHRLIMMKSTTTLYLLLISGFCSFKVAFCNFHYISLQRTHEEAKDYCRRIHTDLATVNNLTDMNDLIASVPNNTVRSWIGLELGDVSRWHWAWPDQKLHFFNWKLGEPQGLGQHSCVAMDPQGEWFESECETQRSFVCHNSIFVANTKSWRHAQKHCRDLSLDLVSVGSADENREVRNVSTAQTVWIGLFRDPWRWSDGSRSSFRFWKPRQPNYRDQDCVAAIFKDDGRWNDLKCSSHRTFVCQGPSKVPASTQTSTQETTVTTPSSNSSSEAVPFNSTVAMSSRQLSTGGVSAFTTQAGTLNTTQSSSVTSAGSVTPWTSGTLGNLILIRENKTWLEALRYCREHYMDLVCVTGQSIQDQVARMAQNATSSHIWLGLRYTCNFDLWFWSCSSADCYQNWAPGQGPSERVYECGLTGALVTTGGQQWVGLPETQQLNFICQDCAG
ncbi:macrophage mannose receptor 1 isoform X1 [Phycodurus eques]|uniref:macrophage mannose receptor 1 isoform X1 n=1 Tax=Phycodurus eques TaxID=693459 RepID=UPI002ACEC028|nr:macrophage mannose receptor 1 isoform X1 [Phycodurus eques]